MTTPPATGTAGTGYPDPTTPRRRVAAPAGSAPSRRGTTVEDGSLPDGRAVHYFAAGAAGSSEGTDR